MEMSGWDDRDFILGRPQSDGDSDISHPTASSGGGRRASHPSRLGLLTSRSGPHTFPWEVASDEGGCWGLTHPLLHLQQLFCLQSCCFPDMLWGCLSHTGLCREPGWLGEVRETEGKGGRWSDAGTEASLTVPCGCLRNFYLQPCCLPSWPQCCCCCWFPGLLCN